MPTDQVQVLKTEATDSAARRAALSALQKMSLRTEPQQEMIALGVSGVNASLMHQGAITLQEVQFTCLILFWLSA